MRGTVNEMKSEDDIAMLAGDADDDAIKAAYETSKEDEKFKNLFKGNLEYKVFVQLKLSNTFLTICLEFYLLNIQISHLRINANSSHRLLNDVF